MANEHEAEPKKARKVDTSNRDATRAIAEVMRQLAPLRDRVAVVSARAQRRPTENERADMLAECDEISNAFRACRQDLIVALMDAPTRVRHHSRVQDVERAIDSLEQATRATMDRLSLSEY